MNRPLTAAVGCVLGTVMIAGCAARRSKQPASPEEVLAAAGGGRSTAAVAAQAPVPQGNEAPLPSEPRVPRASTLETQDQELSAALFRLRLLPSGQNHRIVAEHYRRLGILDAAHDYLREALAADPTDAAAYDLRARIWRDWGAPDLALGDAHRAVYFAPGSPAAHNTLGTVLQALRQHQAARAEFERALQLRPGAAYALTNLCYLSFLESRSDQAIEQCRAAVAEEPKLVAARNNLALAYAAAGRFDEARRELLRARDAAAGQYNVGILSMAGRRYRSAVEAFAAAQLARPGFTAARQRIAQARALAARFADPDDTAGGH